VLLGSMSILTHPMLLAVWSFSIGAVAGLIAAVPTALMSDQVPRHLQGIAVGWLRTVTDGGQIAGPLVMGFLADAIDLSAPFLFGAMLLAVTAWQCRRRAGVMTSGTSGEGLVR
jgi:MFS family permease